MNALWEEFICVCIRKAAAENKGINIQSQGTKDFWIGGERRRSQLKPDILIQSGEKNYIVDTKWKNITNSTPSSDDLQQLFAYSCYWQTENSFLLYPNSSGAGYAVNDGKFCKIETKAGLVFVEIADNSTKIDAKAIGKGVLQKIGVLAVSSQAT